MVAFDGNDIVVGRSGDDDIHGGAGRDILDGQGGDDFVFGEAGNDRLFGGIGRDHLAGGEGDDRMSGGLSGDTYAFGPDTGRDTITGWEGAHTIDLSKVVGFATFAAVKAATTQNGNSTVITLSSDDSITLEHLRPSELHASNFELTDLFLIA